MTSRFNGILTKGRRRSTARWLAGKKNPTHRLVTILKSVVSGIMATLFCQKTEAYNDAENRRYGARRTGHQNLALIRRQTVILQRHCGANAARTTFAPPNCAPAMASFWASTSRRMRVVFRVSR